MNSFHISLTGHRPNVFGGYDLTTPIWNNLRQQLENILEEQIKLHGHVTAHSGMALGADTVWSQAILNVRHRFPQQLQFIAEIPCITQASRWIGDSPAVWANHVQRSDGQVIYSKTYTPRCMLDRNIGMINSSNLVIAVWNGQKHGGTAHAVKHAQSQNKMIFQIHPDTLG